MIDFGFSNHMTCNNDLFEEIYETILFPVKLWDDKEIEHVSKETFDAHTKQGEVKNILRHFLVSNLKNNLLKDG